jgi:thioredoxin-dependent peroxiredoxin
MVEIGKKAPSFRLPAFPEKEVSLDSLRGKQALFFFYSKDNTSG